VRTFRPISQVGYTRDTLSFHVEQCERLGYKKQAAEFRALCQEVLDRWKHMGW
jgi:hypothetical protein